MRGLCSLYSHATQASDNQCKHANGARTPARCGQLVRVFRAIGQEECVSRGGGGVSRAK